MSVSKPDSSAIDTQIERAEEALVHSRGDLVAAEKRLGCAHATRRDTTSLAAEVERARNHVQKLRAVLRGLQLYLLCDQYEKTRVEIPKVAAEIEQLDVELPRLRAALEDARDRSLGENIPGLMGNAFALEQRARRAEALEKYEEYAAADSRQRDLVKQHTELVDRRDDLADRFRDLGGGHIEIDDARVVG